MTAALTNGQVTTVDEYLDSLWPTMRGLPLITRGCSLCAQAILAGLSAADAVDAGSALPTGPTTDGSSDWLFVTAVDAAFSVNDGSDTLARDTYRLMALAWLVRLGLVSTCTLASGAGGAYLDVAAIEALP